jgi:hypothetical protein
MHSEINIQSPLSKIQTLNASPNNKIFTKVFLLCERGILDVVSFQVKTNIDLVRALPGTQLDKQLKRHVIYKRELFAKQALNLLDLSVIRYIRHFHLNFSFSVTFQTNFIK